MPIFTVDSILQISSLDDLFCGYSADRCEYKFELFEFSFKVTDKLLSIGLWMILQSQLSSPMSHKVTWMKAEKDE